MYTSIPQILADASSREYHTEQTLAHENDRSMLDASTDVRKHNHHRIHPTTQGFSQLVLDLRKLCRRSGSPMS